MQIKVVQLVREMEFAVLAPEKWRVTILLGYVKFAPLIMRLNVVHVSLN
jgi:hypothetical protein